MTPEASRSEWITFLTGEALVLGLMGKLLHKYPDLAWLEDLIEEGNFDEPPFASNHPTVAEGLQLLNGWARGLDQTIDRETVDELRDDYSQLFIGPEKLVRPPWESVYFSEERLLFQERTLMVRSWYRRYGLESEKIHNEPDDHIGLELSFVAHLASLAIDALENQDDEQFTDAISAQKDFLQEHLLRWGLRWCRYLTEEAKTDFYKGVASITLGALLELLDRFDLTIQDAPYI